jgi:hypothetical protein
MERGRIMDILIKASGDVIGMKKLYDFLAAKASERLFILCGGGTAITAKLKERGILFQFGSWGREIESSEGILLAKQVLREQRTLVERKLRERGINATVFLPVIMIGDKICHINGDNYVLMLYPYFDKIFVVTLKGRHKYFPADHLRKIRVIAL